MRNRMRPKYSDEELAELYSKPHDSSAFGIDHQYRIATSIAMLNVFVEDNHINTAADLSAGNANIISSLYLATRYVGDIAPRYAIVGPIEETIYQIPHVDLFICSETLEHLDDPDAVMKLIAAKAKYVFVSTPINDHWNNPEHYWTWDREEINQMLWGAGFAPVAYGEVRIPYYQDYGYQLHIGEQQ